MSLIRRAIGQREQAWSKFEIKALDDTQRILEGVATTPTPDRMEDIVEPMGAEFDLPLPFLWQHDSRQPVGHVTMAKPNKEGIPVTIEMARIEEAGALRDRLEMAWQSIKIKLVRGLSIGFSPVEYAWMDTGGIHFIKWKWLELSGVTIPANEEASITAIKSLDQRRSRGRVVTLSQSVLQPSREEVVAPKRLQSWCDTASESIDEVEAVRQSMRK